MLVVKTKLQPSSISGIGLFADETITRGRMVWVFDPRIDIELNEKNWEGLSEEVQKFLITRSWVCKQTNKRIIALDNDRFMNHSEDPNVYMDKNGNMFANRNIPEGTEIVCNYREIHGGDNIWEGI